MQSGSVNITKIHILRVDPGEDVLECVEQFLAEVSGFALERERILLPFADGVDGAFVGRLRCA